MPRLLNFEDVRSTLRIVERIIDVGDLHACRLTAANVDDRVPVPALLARLTGKVFGELWWSKVKTALRTRAARTQESLELAWSDALASVTASDTHHWFAHCGYCTEPN